MRFEEIKNKEVFDRFWLNQDNCNFLCSWEWREFQKEVGQNVFSFVVYDEIGGEEKLVAIGNIVKKSIFSDWYYLYCIGGPSFLNSLGEEETEKTFLFLIDELKKNNIIDNHCLFLRVETKFEMKNIKLEKTIDLDPAKTLILDLKEAEEELLTHMHQKTRYNIKLATKKGVTIKEAGLDRFEEFWKMAEETSLRDGFRSHVKAYYQKMLSGKSNIFKMFLAESEGRCLAGSIMSFYKDTATYLHGASSSDGREKQAPTLLQWYCIKTAKNLGCRYYDFFGIDDFKWPGVTRFKKGFSGQEFSSFGTRDLILKKSGYRLYKFFRKIRRRFRFI